MAIGVVNVVKIALQLVLLPLMARLLGPEEFALYALALPTINLVSLLADGGLGATLAREDESSTLIWSSAFWALLFTGFLLASGSAIFGVFLGYISHQPRLPPMIAALSLSLIFLTLTVVPSARLTRRKHLTIGAGAELLANISGAALAIVFAWHGAGAWSLAAQYLTIFAVRGIVINLAAFQLPTAQFNLRILRPHLLSGQVLIGSRFVEFAGRLAENFATEKVFGLTVLANYAFSNQISKFSTDAAGTVVWTALYAQALTGDKDEVALLHRRLIRLLGVVFLPAVALAAAAAPELIQLLLGPKWSDLSLYLRIFLPLYFLNTVCLQSAPLLLAYDRYEIQFWCMVGLSVGRVVSLILGLWIGLAGALTCVGASMLLYCVAMLIFPAKVTRCEPLAVLGGLIRPTVCSAVAIATFLLILSGTSRSLVWTIAGLAAGLTAYVLCMLVIDRKGLTADLAMVNRVVMSKGHP